MRTGFSLPRRRRLLRAYAERCKNVIAPRHTAAEQPAVIRNRVPRTNPAAFVAPAAAAPVRPAAVSNLRSHILSPPLRRPSPPPPPTFPTMQEPSASLHAPPPTSPTSQTCYSLPPPPPPTPSPFHMRAPVSFLTHVIPVGIVTCISHLPAAPLAQTGPGKPVVLWQVARRRSVSASSTPTQRTCYSLPPPPVPGFRAQLATSQADPPELGRASWRSTRA